jgi:hypothetical protein
MLTLYTSGYNYSTRRCTSIVNWFVTKYLKRYKIEISVHHRGLYREGVYGWVSVTDCHHRPRSFEIEMHNFLTVENYTKILLHECQHILQHVRGDLRDKRGIRCWKGTKCVDMDYEDMPWEIEAIQMEEVLYEEYLTSLS